MQRYPLEAQQSTSLNVWLFYSIALTHEALLSRIRHRMNGRYLPSSIRQFYRRYRLERTKIRTKLTWTIETTPEEPLAAKGQKVIKPKVYQKTYLSACMFYNYYYKSNIYKTLMAEGEGWSSSTSVGNYKCTHQLNTREDGTEQLTLTAGYARNKRPTCLFEPLQWASSYQNHPSKGLQAFFVHVPCFQSRKLWLWR